MRNKKDNKHDSQPDLEAYLRDIFDALVKSRDEAQAGIAKVSELRHHMAAWECRRLEAELAAHKEPTP